MEELTFTAPDGRVVGTARVDPTGAPLPRARVERAPDASAGELSAVVGHALSGHRVVVHDADLAAALIERGATLVRASWLMVLPLPATPATAVPHVDVRPLRDVPFEYGAIMRRAYPPGHPDHEHGDVTPEGAAATVRGYLSGEVVGPLLPAASAEACTPDGDLLGAIFISELPRAEDYEGGPWVTEVFVDPDHQGHGTGRALLTHAIDRLSTEGRHHLGLAVTQDSPARRLYEAMGFVDRIATWMMTVD